MQQILISGKGEVVSLEVPLPGPLPKSLLVRNHYSLISTGTESSAVARRRGWLGAVEKACNSRHKLGLVWDLARRQGISSAWETVQEKLANLSPVGYSSCGQVVEVAGENSDFRPGDLVACMGAGFANHAEYIVVPENLAQRLPSGVAQRDASFGAVGCIAMQGIRNLELAPGETVVVIGLGLIGTVAVMLAKAMGYNVYGVDVSPERVAHGTRVCQVQCWSSNADVRAALQLATEGIGADGVLLAAATSSSDPVNLAFDLCRARGSVSVIGDLGLNLRRDKMYRKELRLRVSCSYGPGRYDASYELDGHDYPVSFVRWTERRNLACFLKLLGNRQIDVGPLISRTFPIDAGASAYAALKQSDPNTYGVVFDYGQETKPAVTTVPRDAYVLWTDAEKLDLKDSTRPIAVGVIGCGSFARQVHLPNLARMKDQFAIAAVASRAGTSAALAARRFHAPLATSDVRVILDDPNIDAVLICTRHRSHASLMIEALTAGKHVFVEKPMCLTVDEGRQIESLAYQNGLVVRVGFNRRFAPLLQHMKNAIGTAGPRLFSCRVNVNSAQLAHWSNTDAEGGRFLGEGVHCLDLCNWFLDAEPVSLAAHFLGAASATNPNLAVTIGYRDGSVGNLIYTTSGHSGIGKEYYEAHGNGRSASCFDFRNLKLFGARVRSRRSDRREKGYRGELEEFHRALSGQSSGEGAADARAGTMATAMALAALENARTGQVHLAVSNERTSVTQSAA